jgi:hypothetical protein
VINLRTSEGGQWKTAIAAFYDNFDHQAERLLPDECAINHLEELCAPALAPLGMQSRLGPSAG